MLLLAEIGKKIASVVSEMSKYESLKTDDGHHTKPTAHLELHLNNTVYFCRYGNSAVLHFIITMACSTIIMTRIKKWVKRILACTLYHRHLGPGLFSSSILSIKCASTTYKHPFDMLRCEINAFMNYAPFS